MTFGPAASKAASDNAALDPAAKEAEALLDGLYGVIVAHGKALQGKDFTYDKEDLREAVESWIDDADYGREHLKGMTKYLDEVLSRANVVKHVKANHEYTDTVYAAMIQYRADWATQTQAIAGKKQAAEEEASKQRIAALGSITTVAAAAGAFIYLLMFLIMLRIDRSVRHLANVRNNAWALSVHQKQNGAHPHGARRIFMLQGSGDALSDQIAHPPR
jgi:hypothetical protein